MFIELSEALACPNCGPPQGLVVVVDRLDGRRVLDGFLGCPICEARFAIRDGVVELGADAHGDAPPTSPSDVDPDTLAELIAALFDVRDGRGYVLLDEILQPAAAGLSELTGGCEVISLTRGERPDSPAAGANSVAGVGETLPVQSGRLRALALGAPSAGRLNDAIRALGPEGRLVVVRPTDETRETLRDMPLRPLADEAIAFLGVVAPAD